MTSPRIYLDTSVYLGILLGETAARPSFKFIQKKTLCSSVLLLIESERNLIRMSREGALSAADYELARNQMRSDQELFLLKEVTLDLCLMGTFPPVRIPRSNDLIHLRTAQWFQKNGGLESFVTLDESQRSAAYDLGLPVVSV